MINKKYVFDQGCNMLRSSQRLHCKTYYRLSNRFEKHAHAYVKTSRQKL